MIKTHRVKIEPNSHMKVQIEKLFNYRRYIWNQGLNIWNERYEAFTILEDENTRPDEYSVRNELVANKQDWQYELSSKVLQKTSVSLGNAWKNFFNPNLPNSARPKFKSKKNYKPTFTTDRARIVKGKLILDKPQTINKALWYPIRMLEAPRFEGKLLTCIVTERAEGLYASLTFETEHEVTPPQKQGIAGVDVNVKRFNYNGGAINIYPDKLERYYQRITHYQRMLARKRQENPHNYKTKRYTKVKTKLRRDYQKVSDLQNDILQKFTTQLISDYPEIHIEDLNVHGMMMSKKMGKNLHRSMFGKLSEVLKYKSEWHERELVLVDRFYPSTQICSECGFQKTAEAYGGKQTLHGDSIHREHQTYYCYNCGAILDRDENAVSNIINFKPKAG